MGGYIMDLRKYVGKMPLIQIGASVILINDRGEILLQKRKDNGLWAYHGGSLEPGESCEEAAAREMREETGLIADELELFGVFSGKEYYYVYPNGDPVYNVDVVFVCRKYHGVIKPDPEEVTELKFFPPDRVPEDLTPQIRTPLTKYIDTIKEEQHHGT